MAVSLPLTLAGSFFSARGLDTLHSKQNAHDAEDATLARFFKQRSAAYHSLASDFSNSLVSEEAAKGFSQDEGASFKAAFFRGLQEADTAAQARVYKSVANDLDNKLIAPYERYVEEYEARKATSRKTLQGHLAAFDKGLLELGKTKTSYHSKCTKADQDEDEAKFHAGTPQDTEFLRSPPSTGRPRMSPLSIPEEGPASSVEERARSPRALMTPAAEEGESTPISSPPPPPASSSQRPLARKSTVADRLRALTKDSGLGSAPTAGAASGSSDQKLEDMEGLLDIAGVVNGTKQWSSFFSTAAQEIPKRTLKIPLWGVYDNLVTGADLVAYFMENLVALEGDYQRAYEFSRQLAEELYLIRLIGEFGNKFSDEHDTFYQFKPEIFHLDDMKAAANHKKPAFEEDDLTKLPQRSASPRPRSASPEPSENGSSSFGEAQASLIKRSGTIFNSISSRFGTPSSPVAKVQKARQEAQEAERVYRATVKRVEVLRMTADQQTEGHLHYMHKLELDRLRFLKATLKRFHTLCQSLLPQSMAGRTEVELMIQAMQPETDLQAICEMYRVTNGYRPQPLVFVDHYGEVLDVNFGVDLQRWTDVQMHNGKALLEIKVPPVLTAMLEHLHQGYPKIDSMADRRRIWYLEIPLTATNALRTALNDARKGDTVPTNLLKQSDLPVVAAVVKLFFLELDPPVVPYASYEQLHDIYPQVAGSAQTDNKADEAGRVEKLKEFLGHLPKVNLYTLDALLHHLSQLIDETKDGEGVDPEDRYLAKLGHSMGRCIARPKLDTGLSLNDRAPAYLLADLVRLRDQILPDCIETRTQLELERFKPKRKRTRPTDMRISRSSIGSADPSHAHELLADQLQQKASPKKPAESSEPSAKPLPQLDRTEEEEEAKQALTAPAPNHKEQPSSVEPDRSVELDPDTIAAEVEQQQDESVEADNPVVEARSPSPHQPLSRSRPGSVLSPPRGPRPVSASNAERDAPFVPPDEPFIPPTEDSSSSGLSDDAGGASPVSPNPGGGLNRAPRIKGTRVAQAAKRFSVPSGGSSSPPGSARLSRSFAHRKNSPSTASQPGSRP